MLIKMILFDFLTFCMCFYTCLENSSNTEKVKWVLLEKKHISCFKIILFLDYWISSYKTLQYNSTSKLYWWKIFTTETFFFYVQCWFWVLFFCPGAMVISKEKENKIKKMCSWITQPGQKKWHNNPPRIEMVQI